MKPHRKWRSQDPAHQEHLRVLEMFYEATEREGVGYYPATDEALLAWMRSRGYKTEPAPGVLERSA